MDPLRQRYYKYFTISGIPKEVLKKEEHANLHCRPQKEKKSKQPKVLI